MHINYPFLFEDACMFSCHFHIKMTVAYACDCMYMCVNFRDEILVRGEECKTRENSIFFLKRGKTEIATTLQVETQEIF